MVVKVILLLLLSVASCRTSAYADGPVPARAADPSTGVDAAAQPAERKMPTVWGSSQWWALLGGVAGELL